VPEDEGIRREFYFEEPTKLKQKKNLKEERKSETYQAYTLKIQKLMTTPYHSRVLTHHYFGKSWGNRKVMTNIILLILLHMQ